MDGSELPAYDAGDHLHPNDAGMQAIANTIKLDLFSTSLKAGVVFKGSSAAENSFLAED